MNPSIVFTYNQSSDETKIKISPEFKDLNFVQKLDFLHDIHEEITVIYNRHNEKNKLARPRFYWA
jgi:hypothetical protein